MPAPAPPPGDGGGSFRGPLRPMPTVRPAPAPPRDGPGAWTLDCRGRALDARPGRGLVVGVLNVTPDSFSDGGRYRSVEAAVDRAGQMADEGAAVVDVGGESTRPGADPVGLDDELARVVPVVEAIARSVPRLLISVDTTKGAVARAALRAGAHLVNDVTGLRGGVGTAAAAAEYGAPLVVMHSADGRGGAAPDADDVVGDVAASLERSARRAEVEGVRGVVLDPGFGFGKSAADNLRLVDRLDRLVALGRPVLVGVSRKSTVGAVLGDPAWGGAGHPAPVSERLYGSLGLAALAVVRGAALVRAHDVRETVEALRTLTAAVEAGRGGPSGGGPSGGGAAAGDGR